MLCKRLFPSDEKVICIDGVVETHKGLLCLEFPYFQRYYNIDMKRGEHPELPFSVDALTIVIDLPLCNELTCNMYVEVVNCVNFLGGDTEPLANLIKYVKCTDDCRCDEILEILPNIKPGFLYSHVVDKILNNATDDKLVEFFNRLKDNFLTVFYLTHLRTSVKRYVLIKRSTATQKLKDDSRYRCEYINFACSCAHLMDYSDLSHLYEYVKMVYDKYVKLSNIRIASGIILNELEKQPKKTKKTKNYNAMVSSLKWMYADCEKRYHI